MRGSLLAVVLGLGLTASGCIGAAQHRGEPLPGWPPPAGPRLLLVDLIAVVDQRQDTNDLFGIADPDGDMKNGVRQALGECSGLRLIVGASPPWERRVVFSTFAPYRKPSVEEILASAFTIFLYPAIARFDVQMRAQVFDGDGKELGTFLERGVCTAYFSPVLFLAWAVWPTSSAYRAECYELARRILFEAVKAGAL